MIIIKMNFAGHIVIDNHHYSDMAWHPIID